MESTKETAVASPNAAWADLMANVAEAGVTIRAMLPPSDDPDDEADIDRVLAMTLAQAYFMNFNADPDAPEWLPFIGQMVPSGAINPDTLYYSARIDPNGVYRISGSRGTSHMLDFQFNQRQPGFPGQSGARTQSVDGDALTLDADGNFELIVGGEKPEGVGDWRPLSPETGTVLMRQVSYDWENELDGRVAIERIDVPIGRPRALTADTAPKVARLAEHMVIYQRQFLGYKEQVRTLGPANQLHTRIRHEKGGEGGGGGMGGQIIYHGNFDLAEDECLLVETSIPSECHYYNIQVSDRLHLALDPLYHQTSLNGHQMRVDSDGKWRAVVSVRDPGVPNWLDTAGFTKGGILGRWTRSNGAPVPETKVVKLSELRDHLPSDTPVVSPEEREERQRARCRAMQKRRR